MAELTRTDRCALDDRALDRQLARFERIGRHALWSRALDGEVSVVLDRDLDDALLREALAIESDCCPFLGLVWDADRRELTIVAPDRDTEVLHRVTRALGAA
jgi:hypothetical protein